MKKPVPVFDQSPFTLEQRLAADPNPVVIVSFGGGTDSTALLIECIKRKVHVDLVLFSDTGGEKPHTYAHIKSFSEYLVAHGYPPIQTVEKFNRYKQRETLEQEMLRRKTLPSVAFGFKSCSQKHKIAPQVKFLNHHPLTKAVWKRGSKPISLIGYNADEKRRANRYENEKYLYAYPLLDWGIGREACRTIIKEAGVAQPDKSACFFCPHSKKPEILDLQKRYPDLARRAVEMEDNAKPTLAKIKGLGRNYAWGDLLAEEKRACDLAEIAEEVAPCGCYDGD